MTALGLENLVTLGNEAWVADSGTSPSIVAHLAGVSPRAPLIEFATPDELLSVSALPFEFAKKLRLQNSDGSLDAEASVVVSQYHNGRTAVYRSTRDVPNWIVKP